MIKDVENKAVKQEEVKQEYFFPDINGKPVTVRAKTREKAEEEAKKLTE